MLTLVFFALGLMAKPMLVTLPFVLLLLDYWPLGRFESFRVSEFQSFGAQSLEAEAQANRSSSPNSPTRHLVREKIPFFILSGIFCVITFLVQKSSGAVVLLTRISLGMRIENAFVSFARYLGRLFWPTGLAVLYPYPAAWPWAFVLFAAVLTVGLSVAGWWLGRRWPFARTGWFWFAGTLIPVIGLAQVGNQSLADRYTYVPSIGIFILLTWGAWAAVEAWIGGKNDWTEAPNSGVTATASGGMESQGGPSLSPALVRQKKASAARLRVGSAGTPSGLLPGRSCLAGAAGE